MFQLICFYFLISLFPSLPPFVSWLIGLFLPFSIPVFFFLDLRHWFVVAQLVSHVQLFVTPWSHMLGFTISWSLLKFMSIEHDAPWDCKVLDMTGRLNWLTCTEWVMPSHISFSVTPFSSYSQFPPASGSFPVSQFFISGGQNIGASASVLPINIQGWLPLGLTTLISLLSRGFSSVFCNTRIQKHQFFSAQPSLWSNSHIRTCLMEKP